MGQLSSKRSKPSPGFLSRFTVLRGAVRELWIVLGVKLLALFAYTVMNQTLVLWLSADLGYSDTDAGYMVMGWSALLSLFTVLVGSFTDAIGLRRTFLLGMSVCIVARVVMTATALKGVALGIGLLPLAMGEALTGPVLVAAIRRYSTTTQRSIAFSLFYAMMNVGILCGNLVFDYVRKGLGEHSGLTLPVLGVHLSTYRTLFLVSALLSVPNLLILYFFLREGVDVTDEGVRISPPKPHPAEPRLVRRMALTVRDALRDTVRIFRGLWGHPGFYHFLLFLALASCLRLVMAQMYYTYPKFGIRELGPGAPVGRLWAVNQFLIIFLVPVVGAMSQKIPAYRMVVCGTFIAAASLFIMAMPPPWFQSLADGGLGNLIAHRWLAVEGRVNPYYVMILLFVVMFSVGEAIYSPRLYEYAASIAPKGQEASYSALSFLPFFLAKIFVGMFSGRMLAAYCPAEGPRHSETLWLIIALTAAVAPVGLLTLRRFIRVHEAGRAA
jgi:MFS family permease